MKPFTLWNVTLYNFTPHWFTSCVKCLTQSCFVFVVSSSYDMSHYQGHFYTSVIQTAGRSYSEGMCPLTYTTCHLFLTYVTVYYMWVTYIMCMTLVSGIFQWKVVAAVSNVMHMYRFIYSICMFLIELTHCLSVQPLSETDCFRSCQFKAHLLRSLICSYWIVLCKRGKTLTTTISNKGCRMDGCLWGFVWNKQKKNLVVMSKEIILS